MAGMGHTYWPRLCAVEILRSQTETTSPSAERVMLYQPPVYTNSQSHYEFLKARYDKAVAENRECAKTRPGPGQCSSLPPKPIFGVDPNLPPPQKSVTTMVGETAGGLGIVLLWGAVIYGGYKFLQRFG